MDDFAPAREQMVTDQLIGRGITDPLVLASFRQVPRELFLPSQVKDQAYDDGPVALGFGQTISQPYMAALMTEVLRATTSDRVLEIGTGSGYQSAILSKIVSEVYTVERIGDLAQKASQVWERLGLFNIFWRVGDGRQGWADKAPFDKIIITAAAEAVPLALWEQLKVDGLLLAPLGPPAIQELVRFRKKDGVLEREDLGGCRFVPLISGA